MPQETAREESCNGIICPECGQKCSSRSGLGQHWSHAHTGPCEILHEVAECRYCGDQFRVNNWDVENRASEYCSRECFNVARSEQTMRECEECGESFKRESRSARKNDQKYCSHDCYAKSIRSEPRHDLRNRVRCECEVCGAGYQLPKSLADRNKYCSRECSREGKSKDSTALNSRYRTREKNKGWTEKIFQRDNYTCQSCNERGGKLHAHHITPVSEIVETIGGVKEIEDHELFANLNNGITLCVECHRIKHARQSG